MNQLSAFKIALAVIVGVSTVISVIFRLNKRYTLNKKYINS